MPSDLVLLGIITAIALIVMAYFLTSPARHRQSQVNDPVQQPAVPPVDVTIHDTAIQSLSARLAAIEGRIGTLSATLEGLPILQSQVAAMQTNMPSLQSAYEQYADQIARADKRDTERDRRSQKTQAQTAGEAAAALTGVVGPGEETFEATHPATPQLSGRSGVIGQGGRGRNRKTGLRSA